MAYSHDAFMRDEWETSKRVERDKKETGERLKIHERDGAMADGLTYTNKIAKEREKIRETRLKLEWEIEVQRRYGAI